MELQNEANEVLQILEEMIVALFHQDIFYLDNFHQDYLKHNDFFNLDLFYQVIFIKKFLNWDLIHWSNLIRTFMFELIHDAQNFFFSAARWPAEMKKTTRKNLFILVGGFEFPSKSPCYKYLLPITEPLVRISWPVLRTRRNIFLRQNEPALFIFAV